MQQSIRRALVGLVSASVPGAAERSGRGACRDAGGRAAQSAPAMSNGRKAMMEAGRRRGRPARNTSLASSRATEGTAVLVARRAKVSEAKPTAR